MLHKKILSKKNVKELDSKALKAINGGTRLRPVVCNSPLFRTPGEPCPTGTHPHPTMPHCICCAD
ncbi:hypothetical protein [Winogradskyella flava]|uniref:Uncharacterized protein n=1 Tax=Winogradskyella flava TaxID=1884876 RepID=A0A842IJN5_9FLAO|nr:hypothetical protein [Winogradskyella flava]MBC2843502.1 hypothetical protein [Winogradskyella flava]